MQPLASMIVPCHNYGRFLGQALDSLLRQTWEPLEVIVIDDGSTDDTGRVLETYGDEPRVQVIRHAERHGHLVSYNEGLGRARGRYVGILSADDYCLEDTALERQVGLFEAHPRVGMVYSAYTMVEDGVRLTPVVPWERDGVHAGLDEFRRLIWGNYVLHSGTLLRADVQAELGPYDLGLPQSGDWDLWLRCALRHDVGYVAQPLYAYRLHRTNMQARGIPPGPQAAQNRRTLERAFLELPPDAPADILAARQRALRHALLQTVWFDLFNGRRGRAWSGVAYALRREPSLGCGGEVWRILPRLAMQTLGGHTASRWTEERWARRRGRNGRRLEPSLESGRQRRLT